MSAARDKGTRAETAVVNFLRGRISPWLPDIATGIDRHPLHGAADVGDIRGVPETVIQVKNTKRIDLAGALDSARLQATNADAALYAAWIKRRGKTNPDQWYVVLDGGTFTDMLLAYLGADVPILGSGSDL
jgi:hypothetical protein